MNIKSESDEDYKNQKDVNIQDLSYINSLRGIAILSVFLVHVTNAFHSSLPFSMQNLFYLGRYGVVLFFLVSSFTLFRSLDIRKENEGHYINNFFIRRFFRIAPAYYLIILLAYLFTTGDAYYQNPASLGISHLNFLSHLVFLNGFNKYYINSILGIEWTVFLEMAFYLFIPLIFKYCFSYKKLSLLFIFSFIISMASCITSGILFHIKSTGFNIIDLLWIELSPLKWFFVFIFGALMYKFLTDEVYKALIKKVLKFEILLMLFVIIATIMVGYFKIYQDYILMSFAIAIFFFVIQNSQKHNIFKIFDNPFVGFVGKVSFSFYLIHTFVINAVNHFLILFGNNTHNFIMIMILSLFLCIILSTCLYNLIEKPGIKLGKTLINLYKKQLLKANESYLQTT